jgi:hypothetical protein
MGTIKVESDVNVPNEGDFTNMKTVEIYLPSIFSSGQPVTEVSFVFILLCMFLCMCVRSCTCMSMYVLVLFSQFREWS